MDASKLNPVELLSQVIEENIPEDIWDDSPFIKYRRSGNTNRGEIGEEFIRRFLVANKIDAKRCGGRTEKTDMEIEGMPTEVKTASLGVNGTFQFNHVRLDRRYKHLLCVGICPQEIVFGLWSKGEVAEEKAGSLVRMAEGQSVTYKITKKLTDSDICAIAELPERIRSILK